MKKGLILKLAIIVLVVVLASSLSLIGCQKTETTATAAETTATAAETTATAVETTATAAETTATAVETPSIKEPENKVTLELWYQEWAGGQSWQTAWIPIFEEKHPNIKVNVTFLPFEELNTKIFPSIAAGNEADLLMFYDEWLLGKDASKIFAPITPQLYSKEEMKKVTFESALSRITGSDGEIYGVPWGTGANAAGILIHKDLFDEAGIDQNSIKTWDDVKEAAKKLTKYKADGKIERSGIVFTYTEAANLFLDMIAEQGAADKMLNVDTGEWNLNIPEAKNSLETLKSFVDDKTFDPTSGDWSTSFPNKLTAMLVIGPWALGAWGDQYPDLKLDYMYMPKYPGVDKNVHTVVSWACMAVSKRLEGEKRDAALIYIKEMLENPEYYDIPFKNGFWVGVPGSKSYVESVIKLAAEGNAPNRAAEIASTVASEYVPSIKLLQTNISEPDLIRAIIFPELQNVFLGQKTVDEVLKYLTTTLTTKEQELK